MLGQVFSTMGGVFGNLMGGGMISTIMRFAGRSLGNYLERSSYDPDEYYHTKYHLDNLYINTSTKGKPIPLVFGKARVPGNIIWSTPIEEVAANSTDMKYFKNSDDVRAIHHTTSYLYYANFAMVLCEGVVSELNRVWINGVETDISEYTYRFYKGDEDQESDPMIQRSMGEGKTPGYRGLCYIVFERLPLENFGGRIPGFSFEVTRKPDAENAGLEGQVRSMIMIPGSGEFVYDTIKQDKIIYAYPDNVELYRDSINHHNPEDIANAIYSLNALQQTCHNLQWVAPVVTWFSNSLDAGEAGVFPAVEYQDPSSKTTEEWNVAGISRENAYVISRSKHDVPNYGGTVNDASLVRYLQEMKRRGLKIMLYPMIFLDVPGKPWRGHMSGTPEGIRQFFVGYKKFILHYAELTKGLVDAFVIGSEMKSLTKVRDGNIFPAVEEFIDLARKVKAILGASVKVTYAADWSEYHHTDGGIYNLDALWASEAIDVIGIDAYFPLTNSTSSDISIEEIKKGWNSGEGYDYYIDHVTGQRYHLDAAWAWKNIEYWWKNPHINADGTKSPWVPRSKKIWFTEFGFPSIDKAPNQPNLFFDPNCVDGGSPRHSNSSVDFAIQRKSIKATLDFWENSEFLENMFLWTWDARPYPAWPHSNVWADGSMWLRGHWVNGKLGISSMQAIILELCKRGGMDLANVNGDTIDEIVSGVVLTKQSSIWDVINLMRLAYFFDIRSNYLEIVEFVKRGAYGDFKLNSDDLVASEDELVKIADISNENTLAEVMISFPDESNAYLYNMTRTAIETDSNRQIYYFNLPIVMDETYARNIAKRIIDSARMEDKLFKFTLTIEYMLKISPGDILVFNIYNNQYRLRITDIKNSGLLLDILGIFDKDARNYKHVPTIPEVRIAKKEHEYFEIFELPESLSGKVGGSIYAASSSKASLYSVLEGKTKIASLNACDMGVVRAVENNPHASNYVIDERSRFTIFSATEIVTPEAAMIGDELVYFKAAKKIGENLYVISSLIRGSAFTEVKAHEVGERYVILKGALEIPVSDMLLGTRLKFAVKKQEKDLIFKELSRISADVCEVERARDLTWKGRIKGIDGWRDPREELEYKIVVESDGRREEFFTKKSIFSLEGISADSKIDIVAVQRGFA